MAACIALQDNMYGLWRMICDDRFCEYGCRMGKMMAVYIANEYACVGARF